MRRICFFTCYLISFTVVAQLRPTEAQSRSEEPVDCGAEICLQTGVSYWRYHPTQYCEGDVCLRDRLADIADLNWDRLMNGRMALVGSNRNPFIGLENAEYQRFRELGNADLDERIEDGETSGFQVTRIRRTYKSLPGGSVGWWVRWISNRFPGITLLDGDPEVFASYEIGLYMGGLVLSDIEYRTDTAEAYASQPACTAR
jgi:hypothetical protein